MHSDILLKGIGKSPMAAGTYRFQEQEKHLKQRSQRQAAESMGCVSGKKQESRRYHLTEE